MCRTTHLLFSTSFVFSSTQNQKDHVWSLCRYTRSYIANRQPACIRKQNSVPQALRKYTFIFTRPAACFTRESAGGGTPPTGMLEIIESDLSEDLAELSVAYRTSMPWTRPRRVRQRSPQRRKQRKPISQTLRTGIRPPYWQ